MQTAAAILSFAFNVVLQGAFTSGFISRSTGRHRDFSYGFVCYPLSRTFDPKGDEWPRNHRSWLYSESQIAGDATSVFLSALIWVHLRPIPLVPTAPGCLSK